MSKAPTTSTMTENKQENTTPFSNLFTTTRAPSITTHVSNKSASASMATPSATTGYAATKFPASSSDVETGKYLIQK